MSFDAAYPETAEQLPSGVDTQPEPEFEAEPLLSLSDAERALRRMARLQAYVERLGSHYAEEEQLLRQRREEALKPYQRELDFLREVYQEPLREVAAAHLPPKGKSVKLAYGTLSFRTKPKALVVTDEDKLIAWAATNCPEALKVSPLRTPLAHHWKTTGEIPEGCDVSPEEQTFSVTLTLAPTEPDAE